MSNMEFDLSGLPSGLRLGTSSFSSSDWVGSFYPDRTKPTDFLRHYATQLPTVEIDATWHALPSIKTVEGWAEKTPNEFVFSLKVPKVITHEKYLVDCDAEWEDFLTAVSALGSKRGPLLLQFQYVSRSRSPEEWETGEDFLRRLEPFIKKMPSEGRFVVEVRNPRWIDKPLLDLLKGANVGLALVEYQTMPNGAEILEAIDPVTTDFGYVRFLGNHREMDLLVSDAREDGSRRKDWESIIQNRENETRSWIPAIQKLLSRNLDVFVYFNNHFAGFAPGSIELFLELWKQNGSTPESP